MFLFGKLVLKVPGYILDLAFGIVFGCLLGMFPLLFIDTDKREDKKEKTEKSE